MINYDPPANGQAPLDVATDILLSLSRCRRRAAVEDALRFLPSPTLEQSFKVGRLRVALATFWEEITRQPIPSAA